VQFVAVGLVTAVLLAVVTGWLSRSAAREEAIQDAHSTTGLLARTVVQPALTTDLLDTSAADVDQFDRLMRARVLSDEVVRVKVWDANGTVVYSDEPRLIGEQFELEDEQLSVLADGGTDAEVSDLTRSENQYEQPLGRVLEVYTRVEAPDGEPLLFELYFSYDDVARRTDQVLSAFRPITVGGILLFLLLTAPLVWLLARRLDDAASDRERLLLAAAQASDAERRRIARDLHDGVVQDLAGTSFALSATAREVSGDGALDRGQLREGLDALAGGVRRSLRSLRSLLVEIYPPDLSSASLPSAMDDLLAPAVASGVVVTLDMPETSGLPENVVALVWRTAQEGVRNALRHGEPTTLAVTLRLVEAAPNGPTADTVARLGLVDDGQGFDPDQRTDGEHFGLRGLRDLAAEAGGTLSVASAPGSGTTVVLEVPLR
jgi:two-component system NarL family sensor kinase